MTTIPQDVETNELEPIDALLKRWEDADETAQPSEAGEEATDDTEDSETEVPSDDEDSDEETEEETEEDLEDDQTEDDEEDETEEAEVVINDDAEVSILVNGEEVKASIKDLKRLYGQEASLTHKSQELAAQRKLVDETNAKQEEALKTLVKRAEDRYRPYSEIDFLVAAKQLSADELTALRAEATAAYEDYKFLTEELNTVTETRATKETEEFNARAVQAIEYLSDPTTGIQDFDQDVYNKIGEFAVSNGMDLAEYHKLTDPVVIKMIHGAMQYDLAKKATTKKLKKTPKKVLKTTAPSDTNASGKEKANKALGKLRTSGDTEDAADALLAKWAD